MAEPTEEPVKVDRLVKVYIKIRSAREALAKKYEEDDGDLKSQMDTIKKSMLECFKQIGGDSIKTEYGTASRTVKTRYGTTDWSELHKFCKEHDALDLMERRISQGNMKTFLAEHPETKIPGLYSNSEYDVSVRSKKST